MLRLPVQVTNKGQSVPLPVREVGLYSQDAEGEYLFAVSWLDGEDTDNIIPPPADPEAADTVHIHDVGIVVTNQEASVIEVSMGLGGMATAEQLEAETKARIEADAALQEAIENAGGGLVVIPAGSDIPVEQRKEGFLYFKVSEEV